MDISFIPHNHWFMSLICHDKLSTCLVSTEFCSIIFASSSVAENLMTKKIMGTNNVKFFTRFYSSHSIAKPRKLRYKFPNIHYSSIHILARARMSGIGILWRYPVSFLVKDNPMCSINFTVPYSYFPFYTCRYVDSGSATCWTRLPGLYAACPRYQFTSPRRIFNGNPV